MTPRPRRRYLVLAMRPDADSLWLEWPNAFGARRSSLVLRSQGWAVTVVPGLPGLPSRSSRPLRARGAVVYS